jgi:predicted nucleic acid-binding Zn ribbon protein
MKRAGKPEPLRIGEAVRQYLAESGLEERIEQAAILPEWADRVGAGIAAVTEPLRVSHGTLVVAVRSSAWLMELKLMEREIVRRLNVGRTSGRIEGIRFVMAETG